MTDTSEHVTLDLEPSTPQPYEYTALSTPSTLRVLCLEPADSHTDPLHVSLIHIDRYEEIQKLENRQQYSAVSYTWGEPIFSERLAVACHGASPRRFNRYLQVTQNVITVLQHLRKPHKHRYLWIDAICLNQANEAEKAQQVPLMGEIFSQSHRVFFWLGMPGDGGHDVARIFALLRHLALMPESELAHALKVFDECQQGVEQLRGFFRRHWFFRRWILQEVSLARQGTILVGKYSLPKSIFFEACKLLKNAKELEDEYGLKVINTLSSPKDGVFSLLFDLHLSKCSDHKDRIAALHGLLPKKSQLTLDYTLSYHQLYTQYAVKLANNLTIEIFKHLYEFGAMRANAENLEVLPTWIPDWSRERNNTCPQFSSFGSTVLCIYRDWRGPREDSTAFEENNGRETFIVSHAPLLLSSVLLTAHMDASGVELKLSWGFDWAGLYGRLISEVITVTKQATLANTWSGMRTILAPLERNLDIKKDFLMNGKLPRGLLELSLLVENFMELNRKESLACFKSKTRTLGVGFALYAALTSEIIDVSESLLLKLFNDGTDSRYTMQECLLRFIRDLCWTLDHFNCTIAETELPIQESLNGEQDYSYVIGPANMEKGMRVVPLDFFNSLYWPIHPGWHDLDLEKSRTHNAIMIVIQYQTQRMTIETPQEVKGEMSKKRTGFGGSALHKQAATLPLKCHYVGQGTGIIIVEDDFSRRENIKKDVLSAYQNAKKEGRPPPFTIDII